MNDKKQKKQVKNPIESLFDTPRAAGSLVSEELFKPIMGDLGAQVFGRRPMTGEIKRGEAEDFHAQSDPRQEELKRLRKQLAQERKLRQEIETYEAKRTQELQLQINEVRYEVVEIAKIVPDLNREVEMATLRATSDPSKYELFFISHILQVLRGIRERINEASTWIAASNKRAAKRGNWVQNYKAHGSKYLLSGEHYSSRSAA